LIRYHYILLNAHVTTK